MPCIRICKTDCPKCHPEYDNGFEELRKIWEEWDLRILVLFILFTHPRKALQGQDDDADDRKGVSKFGFPGLSEKDNPQIQGTHLFCLTLPEALFYSFAQGFVTGKSWRSRYHDRLALRRKSLVGETPHRTLHTRPKNTLRPDSNLDSIWTLYSCPVVTYSWDYQTLNPHIADYECSRTRLESLVTRFSESVRTGVENLATGGTVIENSFKLIEIELGLIYDMLFSKMPPGHLEGDVPITIILLVGAIILEIAGILVQLVSDWVIVWACKYPGRLANLVLRVHEFLISEHKRWSGFMGQLSFLNFCKEYKPTRYRKMVQSLCGREKMLSRFGSLSAVKLSVKKLIIIQLFEKYQKGSEALQTPAMKREDPNVVVTGEMEAANILSNYMMYLLLELVGGGGSRWSNAKACENLLEKKVNSSNTTVANQVQNLAKGLREKANRWEIMSNVWVEMLCYASSQCPSKHHVQELRHGGEFLTHVWLSTYALRCGEKGREKYP
ncbi:hypothetical protein Acr_08g0004970 [Actinidia rufa]|uniref:DUF4220 domain-containing protein n=1 Tax=Actinidia rufa TaxID=165716 RepID=A0A7J0F085_9ERIC|nr:hypothetical protein Acr_08g0004970 [Actinidia rufa]